MVVGVRPEEEADTGGRPECPKVHIVILTLVVGPEEEADTGGGPEGPREAIKSLVSRWPLLLEGEDGLRLKYSQVSQRSEYGSEVGIIVKFEGRKKSINYKWYRYVALT